MELTIKNTVYQFKAGFGFLREANKRAQADVPGTKQKQDIGLKFLVAGLIDGSAEALLDTLDLLNLGMEPRVSKEDLEEYLEDPKTSIDELFKTVLDFLSKSNISRREVTNFMAEVEKKAKEDAEKVTKNP